MAQYTAVQYLIQQINNIFGHDRINVDQAIQLMNVTNTAMKIEKEQIIKAHGDQYDGEMDEIRTGERYYQETYKAN